MDYIATTRIARVSVIREMPGETKAGRLAARFSSAKSGAESHTTTKRDIYYIIECVWVYYWVMGLAKQTHVYTDRFSIGNPKLI